MTKGDALIRDIAKLFTKYSLADWQFVLELLRRGGPEHIEISRAIEEITAKRGKSTPGGGKRHLKRLTSLLDGIDPSRAEFLRKVQQELRTKKTEWKLADIRDIYVKSGGKDQLPKKRDDAVRALVSHLARLPDEIFTSTVKTIPERSSDLQSDYARWFEMIYSPTKRVQRDESADLAFVADLFGSQQLQAIPFSKAEVGSGKTPDFRIMRGDQLLAYCEVKSPNDEWLDRQLDGAKPFEIVGGLRNDPTFNRLSNLVHKAVAQFDAVNPDRAVPNILVFVNYDRASNFADLRETLTGMFFADDGTRYVTMKHVSEGRIREEKYRIDAYVWADAQTRRIQGCMFSESISGHIDAVCSMLALHKDKIRR